jgi:hypothetical protein
MHGTRTACGGKGGIAPCILDEGLWSFSHTALQQQWWNDTDKGNWSTGWKTLHSVGGRWMDEYGAMVEWYWQGKTAALGEKTLWQGKTEVLGERHYSVGVRWMSEYGAIVEWYWQGKTAILGEKHSTVWVVDGRMSMEQWWNDTDGKTTVLGEKHSTVWVVDGWMSMEQWWNDTDKGKLKYYEKIIITGENWSTGRKTLYTVSGRWMKEYGAMTVIGEPK